MSGEKQRLEALVRTLPDVDQAPGVDFGEAQGGVAIIERSDDGNIGKTSAALTSEDK